MLKISKQLLSKKGLLKYKIILPSKGFTVILMLILGSQSLFAQDQVQGKLNEWRDSIITILNTVVGIFAIVGGFLIFIQYMQGNEQAQKNFIRFIIGLAIFGLVAFIANLFIPDANIPT